jgi:hypothetical protein
MMDASTLYIGHATHITGSSFGGGNLLYYVPASMNWYMFREFSPTAAQAVTNCMAYMFWA